MANDASEGQRYFVDGSTDTRSIALPLEIEPGGSGIAIGGGPENEESGIDEVSIWSRALTRTEMQQLSGGGSGCAVVEESP